jgi:hypothetical protein
MPLVQTRGAASAQGFGEFAQAASGPVYIEDVFSTFLYTGTGASLTITNGIDLSGKGGLVWGKKRSGADGHALVDTVRGGGQILSSDNTAANTNTATYIPSFSSSGFETGVNMSASAATYASWTFRKQPKFFDVVTYTGTGSARTVAHNLGSVPGCILFKRTDGGNTNWRVYHRSIGATKTLKLNTTDAEQVFSDVLNDTEPTSTVFTVGSFGDVNGSGQTYVAYLFAHDAGGFGLTGTDNVISCGSFTTDASYNATVNLGYEPQWILVKNVSSSENWYLIDNMRGWSVAGNSPYLRANTSSSESSQPLGSPTATGFTITNFNASSTNIYIAIRRGPMKVPTLGTSVFTPIARTGTGAAATVTGVGFPPDLVLYRNRTVPKNTGAADRLRGANLYLATSSTAAEGSIATMVTAFNMDGISVGNEDWINTLSDTYINWFFQRAPGFFDEVCYTGTGSATTQTHNLAAVPELMIVKRRNAARYWAVYAAPLGATKWLELETQDAVQTDTMWNNTTPTASVFSIGTYNGVNGSGDTYVAYLFATCPGVSKVGSYTGNGTTQTINCGFTGGARFVLLKRTDSTGDWYVWDSARGIVAGNDPHLSLNTTAAEVTTDDSVDTDSTGFVVNQLSATNINVTSASYIFLSVA